MNTPILFALVCAACNAQDSAASPVTSQQQSDAAQVADYIVAALEDRHGKLWFGTNGQGVACYTPPSEPALEGELRYFSIEDGLIGDVVTDIAEDREGRLWFGTQTGASRYDASIAQVAGGKPFTGFGPAAGLPGAGCKLLVDRKGSIWAGTSAGVFRFDGERFEPFPLPIPTLERLSYKIVPGKVWDLLEDRQGNIWFARDGYGACKYDPKAALDAGSTPFATFTKQDGLCSSNVADIVEDHAGNIWFGSITSDHPESIAEGGLSRYEPSASLPPGRRKITQFPEQSGLTDNDIYNLCLDRAGRVWIGAVRVGAYCFDPSQEQHGRPFTLYNKTNRPELTTTFGVQAMLEDRHGTLWFGFSGGLFRFDGTSFVNVTRAGPWTSP